MKTKTVLNKNLKPGMVMYNGTVILNVQPWHWAKEVMVTFQRVGHEPYTSIWSANASKQIRVGE